MTGPVSARGDADRVMNPQGVPCVDCSMVRPAGAPPMCAGGVACGCSCHQPPAPKTFADRGLELGQLVDRKQAAYGDSFTRSGDVMRALYPKGIAVEQLDDALAVVRVVDKLFRIATDRDALGESPWADVAGYGLLGQARAERRRAARGAP